MKVECKVNYSINGEDSQEIYMLRDFPSFQDGWKHFSVHIEQMMSNLRVRVSIGMQTQKKMEIELKAPWHQGVVGTGIIEVVDSMEAGLMCGAGEDLG